VDIDLTPFNYSQLSELKERIATRMREIRATGVEELRTRLIADAAAIGLEPGDVFALKKARRKRQSSRHEGSPAE
jgi:hypothetical protein